MSRIDVAVTTLRDRGRAQTAEEFLGLPAPHEYPGLFVWWGDDVAVDVFSGQLGVELPGLLYAGQAGATRLPPGERATETLFSRIASRHLTGGASSSGFRFNVSALLVGPLQLHPGPQGRFAQEDDERVSAWILQHLRVATFAVPERDELAELESAVVHQLDPPLNVDHMPTSKARAGIARLRSGLAEAP